MLRGETTFRFQFVWLQMIFARKLPYALKNPLMFSAFFSLQFFILLFSRLGHISTHSLVHGQMAYSGVGAGNMRTYTKKKSIIFMRKKKLRLKI